MIRKQWIFSLCAAVILISSQRSAVAQYGPPKTGSSAAIEFTPATVNLVAGLNGAGATGNGGLATAAQLNYPVGIAYDSSGNLFVADAQNYVVRRIDHTTGNITVFAGTSGTSGNSLGGGVATSAQFGLVAGLAIDSSNNVYVSDRTNNLVWKITSAGAISVYAGGGSGGLGDGGLATAGTLNNPWALSTDASNNIYISDSGNNLVRVVDHSTNIITTFAGVAADATGGCVGAGTLYSTSTPPYTPTQAHLCFPQGVAFDSSGNAYIVDTSNHIVRVVNKATGFISTFAGGGVQAATVNGIPATSEAMSPSGVFVDPGNRVYIADYGGSLVRVVDSTGNINTVFGNSLTDLTSAAIGTPDTQYIVNNVGPADGIDDMAMDTFGNLIGASSSGATITSAGTTGQYHFPNTPILTTETTTAANGTSTFYPPYIIISNPSGVALNFTAAPVVTGPFAVVTGTGAGTCIFPGSLAAGQSCTVVVSFTPTLGGSPGTLQTGTIVLASNANSSPSTINLDGTGTGTATTSATVTPSLLTFTSPVNFASAAQTATLTNTGQTAITIGSYASTGSSFSNFLVTSTTCPSGSTTLAAGASCTYSIAFTPTSMTTYTSGFQVCITTASYGCINSEVLTGTGTAAPTVTFLPGTLAFGSQTVNQASAPMTATLTNTSSLPVAISGETTTGTAFTVVSGTNSCGSTLAGNSSCKIYVVFDPTTTGSFSSQLSVADNAAGTPQSMLLTGLSVPGVTPPNPLVFNPAPVGVSLASAQTLTATFQVTGFSTGFTPTAKLHYGLSYSIGAVTCTGPTGALSCSVPVTFQPQYPGGRREALFLMVGSTRLATVLIYGVGQSPFALVQPGLLTTPILNSSGYNYSSIVDENGTAYVIQSAGNAVVSVTKAGVVTTLPLTGINVANELGIDGAGVLYIAGGSALNQITTYDTVQGVQGSIPYGSGISSVEGLAVGNTGNLYETDGSNVYTVPVSGTGTAATVAIHPTITQGYILASDSNEDIFISGYTINEIPFGGTQVQVNTVGAGDGLGVDAANTLYATRYAPTGGVAELPASGYGTAEGSFDSSSQPLGTSVGPDGTVYVGNYNNLDKVDRSQGVIAFGQVGAVANQNAIIYNGGNQPLTITNIVAAGAGFSYAAAATNPCVLNTPIAPGAVCQVTVTLTAIHAGFYSGTLTYTDNSLNGSSSTQTVALSGMSFGNYIVPSPASLNFGNQAIGTTSGTQLITLTNYGEGYTATIGPISGGGPFTFAPGSCTTPLPPASSATSPGGSCQLVVTFAPTTTTVYNNTQIGITASGPGIPTVAFFVSVSGTGTTGTTPLASLSPSSITFPATTVGVAATPLPVTLSNPGTGPLTISNIAITGLGVGVFGQTNTCGNSLAAGASCTINVSFTPTGPSLFAGTLTVGDNAAVSIQTIPIGGSGTAALVPQATLSPSSLTFPSTTVGVAATPLPVTLSNPGTGPLSISNIGITGLGVGIFGETNTCGNSLAAGASCTINVSFTPTGPNLFAGTLTVSDNAAVSIQTIPIGGSGAAALVPQATLNPSSLTFASTTVGVTATTQPITLSNPGTGALAITGITVTGANASSFGQTNNCGSSVAAGGSCTITVSFTPGTAGALAAALSVADNASGSPQSIAIGGTGVAGTATFTVRSSTPSSSIQPGGVAQFNLVIAPVGGSYSNVVTLTATGLPAGAQASFAPVSVTPGTAGAPSVLSIQTVTGLASLAAPGRPGQSRVPLMALLAGLPLLGFAGASRRLRKSAGRWMVLGIAVLSVLPLLALSGCGGGYFGPAPQTYTVTVVGTSGALQQTTTVSLTVQ
ncbi:MAG TPA: choice-of-anchor D domain-containing protein [Acidobacteriaceae bacterium]|nr:choice-of-anchor D domain-containing protein [Acidobacteriaceae bacterium]